MPKDSKGPSRNDHDDHEDHEAAFKADMADAKETLERVRMEAPFRKALWGYRFYYIGILSSVGSIIVSCFDGSESPMVVLPVMVPLAVLGYLYGYMRLKDEFRAFLAASSPEVWHSRRDRKNMWQLAIFVDSFMGRRDR